MRQATLMKMKPIEATSRASVRRSIRAASGQKMSCGAAIQIERVAHFQRAKPAHRTEIEGDQISRRKDRESEKRDQQE